MTVTSPPPGIPSAPRLAGWIGGSLGGEPAELEDIQLIAGGRSKPRLPADRLGTRCRAGARAAPAAARPRAVRRARHVARIPGAVPLAGTDVPVLGSFGYFKLTVVLEGIYARYSQHQTVGEGFEHEGLAVPT
jgi:hypothetical protein